MMTGAGCPYVSAQPLFSSVSPPSTLRLRHFAVTSLYRKPRQQDQSRPKTGTDGRPSCHSCKHSTLFPSGGKPTCSLDYQRLADPFQTSARTHATGFLLSQCRNSANVRPRAEDVLTRVHITYTLNLVITGPFKGSPRYYGNQRSIMASERRQHSEPCPEPAASNQDNISFNTTTPSICSSVPPAAPPPPNCSISHLPPRYMTRLRHRPSS
jgi:hypothetical protein